MKPAIAPRRLGHLNLFVSNLEASGVFYRQVCGFEEVFREPGIAMIFLSNGNSHHDVGLMEITSEARIGRDGHVQVQPGNGQTPGLNHLGFEMQSEAALVAAWNRASEANVGVHRTTDHGIARSMYMRELNGHTFEFYADMVLDWRQFYAENEGELITGHWKPDADNALTDCRASEPKEYFINPDAALAARNVAYAALPVKSLDASITYYTDVLGMKLMFHDPQAAYAVLGGIAGMGCDIVLRQCATPPVRLLFGGVRMHEGQPVQDGLQWLRAQHLPAAQIGGAHEGAIAVLDPDGIPLLYSTAPALDLMIEHGPAIFTAIEALAPVAA